jgi:hypothetical protein
MAEKKLTFEEKKQQNEFENRRIRFKELLGENCELVDAFVIHTHISPWELKALLDRGCPKETALEILL